MRSVYTALLLLLSASLAHAGQIPAITIPDAKDAIVVSARDAYNARERGRCLQPGPPVSCADDSACAEGRSCLVPLTTLQYVKSLIAQGVVEELTRQAIDAAKAEVDATQGTTAQGW